jgi:hypothetical protein
MLTLVAIYATHAVMNLGEYAQRLGVSDKTAWRW